MLFVNTVFYFTSNFTANAFFCSKAYDKEVHHYNLYQEVTAQEKARIEEEQRLNKDRRSKVLDAAFKGDIGTINEILDLVHINNLSVFYH